MQSYTPDHNNLPEIEPDFFQAQAESLLETMMDDAAEEKMTQGYRVSERRKIGRNEPCPCGSNKKFKKCCIHKARR